ncbi:hypothetical protein R1flu_015837 [Riccia fluitans]|uniref:Uncharacterized protein n=1 Tax=Riccia fluitans TaxID=41844 RepID=A0ABD1YK48_9MARC
MFRERHCCSVKVTIERRKMRMELAMFKQQCNSGLTALRFAKSGELPRLRRKKTIEDLERGWSNNYQRDISPQPLLKPLPCFGYKEKAVKVHLYRSEPEKLKTENADKGWVDHFTEQKTKELDDVYGKASLTNRSIDKRLEAGWVGNCKELRRESSKSTVTVAEWQKVRFNKRMGISPISGRLQRSDTRTSKDPKYLKGRTETFLDSPWDKSTKRIGADLSSPDTLYGDLSDAYAYRSVHENRRELEYDHDIRWPNMRSLRREACEQNVLAGRTTEEMIQERDDLFQDNSWLTAYQHGQKKELFGLRSYSIGDNNQRGKKEDLTWAAKCRAKLKTLTTPGILL